MKKSMIFALCVGVCLVFSPILMPSSSAQDPPIRMNLVADKTTYGPSEPIKIQVRTFNNTAVEVITLKGFLQQDFHLVITFIDPDGIPVKSRFAMIDPEPGPPYRYAGRDTVLVEIVPPDGESMTITDDAHAYYDLTKFGWYTAQVLVPLETFSEYVTDQAGDLLGYLDDSGREAFNPLASNKIRFEIVSPDPAVPTSSIHAKVNLLKIGAGTKPGATKTPLENVSVRLILKSDIPEDYYPVNYKTYSVIWHYVDPKRSGFTDAKGVVTFQSVPKTDYVLLALYNESPDFKHMGGPIGSDNEDWLTDQPIEKNLMVMEKYNKKKVPGKTTRRKGSDLLITEPEYVAWDSVQETYPFVFETIGEWQVETSVAPPEGFVADYKALDADVTNEIEVVQFTITDEGSRWEETDVKFKVKHKGKNENIKTKIGIKLSKKLQKEKGLGPYGHTKHPGPFKGGKKVGKKD